MKKRRPKTVPVHSRLAETDIAEVDKAASEQPIPLTRSRMIALIVRLYLSARGQQKTASH